MPLPVSKGEFNRLGDRLVEKENPSEDDLNQLAFVLASYQEVLEQVKVHLRDLGFAPSGRVKTTGTMIDKLRRTRGMELSRMQDLAGARIVVADVSAQEQAKDAILQFYASQGCDCRGVDRRTDPRFGYRAVHLIVRVDGILVEIQIRSGLQDTWAQIVERLADRWGRGIRYGQGPESPDNLVRSGELVLPRREAMSVLMSLSDAIAAVERKHLTEDRAQALLKLLGAMAEALPSVVDAEKLTSKIPTELIEHAQRVTEILERRWDELDDEDRVLLDVEPEDVTVAQLLHMLETSHVVLSREHDERSAELRSDELRLRDILQLIAHASDEDGDHQ